MINWGSVPLGAVLPFPFATYGKTNGESITLTGLAVTDIEVYKGTSMTQRASDAGYTLLDTDGIDVDGVTGIHGFSIDTGDNTDPGFYAAGSFYWVVVSAVTVDSQTVNFIAGTFSLRATESVAGVPEVDVTHNAGTAITAASGIQEVKVASIANGAITAAAIATGAIDADAIAADAVTEIQSGLATSAALATVDSKVDAILVDTGTDIPATLLTIAGYIDTEVAAIKAVTDNLPDSGALTSLATAAVVDAIKAKTDSLTFTTAGRVDASVRDVNGSTAAAARLERAAASEVLGTVGNGSTTTSIVASALSPTSAVNDQFNGRIIIFAADTTTTALRGQATDITDYDHASTTFTVTALTTAPSSGDTFVVV